jgi:steroid delta-isomerase-like uncharacterized protein
MDMTQNAETVFRRLVEEVINGGNLSLIDELVTLDYVDHTGGGDGPDGYRETVTMVRSVFPDLRMTIEDMIPSGDRVAARFTVTATHVAEFLGVPATGRTVTWEGIGIVRVVDGKMAERWNVSDMLAVLDQIRE